MSRPYDASAHALIECNPDVAAADADLAPLVTHGVLDDVMAQVPDEWLPGDGWPSERRTRYVDQLLARQTSRPA